MVGIVLAPASLQHLACFPGEGLVGLECGRLVLRRFPEAGFVDLLVGCLLLVTLGRFMQGRFLLQDFLQGRFALVFARERILLPRRIKFLRELVHPMLHLAGT